MRTYAKMRVSEGSGFVPPRSVGTYAFCSDDLVQISDVARLHYRSLMSAGFPFGFKCLYDRISLYLGDLVHLLDFKTINEFNIFSQIPEKYIERGRGLTLLEDSYSFLRWDGSFVGAGEDGFGSRYLVRQKVLSCTVPLVEHVGDFTVLSQGETVKQAFDTVIYSRGWNISGILFEQVSDDSLMSAVLYLPVGHKGTLSPYG